MFTIDFAPERYIPVHSRPNDSPIHLSVNQLRVIYAIRSTTPFVSIPEVPEAPAPPTPDPVSHDHFSLLMRSLNTTVFGTAAEQALGSFTRRKLKRLQNWDDWLQAEAKQLDSMAKQEMYGPPLHPPAGAIILRQIETIPSNPMAPAKLITAAMACPIGTRTQTRKHVSSCIEQPCMRLFFALCAHEGYICLKVDATKAYANSPPPEQPTFVFINEEYADWYYARTGTTISRDMVLPVQHALQGHPESGALWERFVNKVLTRHGFKSTTHERSLYRGSYDGHKMLISQQVDDLAIGCHNIESIQKKLVNIICSEDKIDLRDKGILNSFNGVVAHYGWASASSRESGDKPIEPIAMSTTPQLFADYDMLASTSPSGLLKHDLTAGFSYRSVLGTVMYVYVIARPNIGFAVTLLARFSDHPEKVHFDSLRRLARYLRRTKNWDLFYSWRTHPVPSLPAGTFSILKPDPLLPEFPQPTTPTTLAGYVDAAHAFDLTTRRSITGLVFMLCGCPIAYKSKVQPTVSTSSTEAEFIAAMQAAKIAKYLRSNLHELDYAQPGPTVLYKDNQAAIFMINTGRPMPRSRHIDIQHFAIQEWKTNGDIVLCHIPGPTLHFRYVCRLMGHYEPLGQLVNRNCLNRPLFTCLNAFLLLIVCLHLSTNTHNGGVVIIAPGGNE